MYGWVSTFKPYATSFPVLLMLVKLPYLCQKGFIDIYFYSQDKANQARQGSNAHLIMFYTGLLLFVLEK